MNASILDSYRRTFLKSNNAGHMLNLHQPCTKFAGAVNKKYATLDSANASPRLGPRAHLLLQAHSLLNRVALSASYANNGCVGVQAALPARISLTLTTDPFTCFAQRLETRTYDQFSVETLLQMRRRRCLFHLGRRRCPPPNPALKNLGWTQRPPHRQRAASGFLGRPAE